MRARAYDVHVGRYLASPFAMLLLAGCLVQPTVKSEAFGHPAAARDPGCVLEVSKSSLDLEQVGQVVVMDEEQRDVDDPALIALIRPAACRLGGEVVIGNARPFDEGGARKSRDVYDVMRRKAAPPPPLPIASAPEPVLPAVGIKGTTNATIRGVRLVPGRTEIELEVWPTSGPLLGIDIAQSRILELTDDHGASLLASDATVQVWSGLAQDDRPRVTVVSDRSVPRDAHRIIARVRLAMLMTDTTARVRATLAPKEEKAISTSVGVVHAKRTDGLTADFFDADHPPRKTTTIRLEDLDDRLIRLESARVDGKTLDLASTSLQQKIENGHDSKSRSFLFPPTSRPVEIELSVITPKLETMDLEIVAAVPE